MNKNVIIKKDYECYSFKVPWNVSFGMRRKKFLFGELEKLHPCFSNESKFDSKLKLSKKGLKTDVVVMSGLKLAEYKARFPGKKLYLEDNLRKSVFDAGKKKGLLIFAALLSLAAGIFAGISLFSEPARLAEKEVLQSQESSNPEKSLYEERSWDLLFEVFLVMQKKSGEISELTLKNDGYNESLSMSLAGLYPEDFLQLKERSNLEIENSNVSYKDGNPSFMLTAKTKIRRNKMSESQLLWRNGNTAGEGGARKNLLQHAGKFREILSECGAELIEESSSPWGIRFSIRDLSLFECDDLIQKITDNALKENVGIGLLSIKKTASNSLEIQIKSNDSLCYFDGVNLESLKNNVNLFKLEQSRPADLVQVPIVLSPEDIVLENEIKLGEIIHKDGSKTLFYKNKKGKIEKKEEA